MIKSESQAIWAILKSIILWPVTLIKVIGRKRPGRDLFEPFTLFYKYIKQAKVTFALIIINIAMFILMAFLPQETVLSFANYPADLFQGRLHTLVTSGFLHANLLHLIGNMLALFIFGRVVERELGSQKMSLVYFLALIISNVFSSLTNYLILDNNIPGVGASGAIMGLVATAILLDPFYITYQLILPMPIMIIGWLYAYSDITGVLEGVSDGVGRFAHLGGFISITLIVLALEYRDRRKLLRGLTVNVLSLIILSAAYFLLGSPSLS